MGIPLAQAHVPRDLGAFPGAFAAPELGGIQRKAADMFPCTSVGTCAADYIFTPPGNVQCTPNWSLGSETQLPSWYSPGLQRAGHYPKQPACTNVRNLRSNACRFHAAGPAVVVFCSCFCSRVINQFSQDQKGSLGQFLLP